MSDAKPLTVDELPSEVMDAIRGGSKIEAIKMLRVATGIGLANAKVLVDEAARREGLQRVYPVYEDRPNIPGNLIKGLVLAVVLFVGYRYLFGG